MTQAATKARPTRSVRPSLRRVSIGAVVVMLLGAVAITGVVSAFDDAGLSIEHVQGAGWSAIGLKLSISLEGDVTGARLAIKNLHSASFKRELQNIQIDCPSVSISVDAFACEGASIEADWPGIGEQSMRANVRYGRRDGALDVALAGVRLAEGSGEISLSLRESGWRAAVDLRDAPVELLQRLAREFGVPPAPVSADQGRVTLTAMARGGQDSLQFANIDASFTDLTLNNDAGSVATDKLAFTLRGDLQRVSSRWKFAAEVGSTQGQAYVQPIFLDMAAHGLQVTVQGLLDDAQHLTLERFSFDHRGVAQVQGSARIEPEHEQPLRTLDAEVVTLQFPGAYESYLQPLLLDTSFKSMTTAGDMEGSVTVVNGAPTSLDLEFNEVSFDDGDDNFALFDLTGRWRWRAAMGESENDDETRSAAPDDALDSVLQWRAGAVLGLALGASELRFNTSGRQIRLLNAARIPVLDGAIDLKRFRVRNAGAPNVAFLIDAAIEPISVQRLCEAFGWPEFGGQIGGEVSGLRMRDGVITLGTTLQAQVFDGAVRISDLRLEQPFGQWPRYESNIALERLDLELVTRAFSFGRITGRLSGAIEGLQLFNWTPVAFDADFFTTPGDRSRRRISQRAVQNIGAVGGGGAGVTAALSGGVMRFFDEFSYDQLGLSCRLENEICHMSGVAPAPNGGYYLVRGRGLPRINVIGNARRVDWPRLVQQLIAITESEGAVVGEGGSD